jgi:hypothetical protein
MREHGKVNADQLIPNREPIPIKFVWERRGKIRPVRPARRQEAILDAGNQVVETMQQDGRAVP